MQFTLGGLHLRQIDVKVSYWITLELLLRRLVAVDIGQAADPVALQAAMQRRARQVRDRRLQGVEAVVQGKQSVTPKGDDDRLLLFAENG